MFWMLRRQDVLESVTCNERAILSPVRETVDSPWPKNSGKYVMDLSSHSSAWTRRWICSWQMP